MKRRVLTYCPTCRTRRRVELRDPATAEDLVELATAPGAHTTSCATPYAVQADLLGVTLVVLARKEPAAGEGGEGWITLATTEIPPYE